jgi:hypothetical protein
VSCYLFVLWIKWRLETRYAAQMALHHKLQFVWSSSRSNGAEICWQSAELPYSPCQWSRHIFCLGHSTIITTWCDGFLFSAMLSENSESVLMKVRHFHPYLRLIMLFQQSYYHMTRKLNSYILQPIINHLTENRFGESEGTKSDWSPSKVIFVLVASLNPCKWIKREIFRLINTVSPTTSI